MFYDSPRFQFRSSDFAFEVSVSKFEFGVHVYLSVMVSAMVPTFHYRRILIVSRVLSENVYSL